MMNPGTRFAATGLLIVITVAVMATLPAAAADDDPLAEGWERHLNGHGFLPSIYVDDPFVASNFANHTGGGMAMDLQTTFKDLEGNDLFTLTGDLLFASLGLGYQQKLGSRWAVGAYLAALVRSGTNAESFLTEGADVDRNVSLWVKYRLRRTDKCQLSVGLNWDYSKTLYFLPYDFAQDIANDVPIEDADILIDSKVWTSRIAINWARGFPRPSA